MKRIFLCLILPLVILSQIYGMAGCKRVFVISDFSQIKAPVAMLKKEVDLVFVQEFQRLPAHILYKRQDHYAFIKGQTDLPFRLEMLVNPLMRDPMLFARVMKNGKTVREFAAKKTATAILSENKSAWTPSRSKLALVIPFLNPGEVAVVTTTYEWMDVRFLPPLFLQEEHMPTLESRLTVDVPYGVTMHFKAAKNRDRFDFVPKSFAEEKSLWLRDDNRTGLGMRYVWNADVSLMSPQEDRAHALQVLLSFETPSQNDAVQRFDNWPTVAGYLYQRIDRYDMPSNEITSFTDKETRDFLDEEDKIAFILSFLKANIEIRKSGGSFLEQDLQPATRTFARRYGCASDVTLLGISMLNSIGIRAYPIAAADIRYNPFLPDFPTPAVFSSIILAYVNKQGLTSYFDPETNSTSLDQLSPHRQGQLALMLQPKNGTTFNLPYDSAQKNQRTYSYQLWMNEEGVLEGEYSIDLSGFEAARATRDGSVKLRSKSIPELEAYLYGMERTDFALESVEHLQESSLSGVRVSGLIKPRLLFKNNQGGYNLKLEKIIEPALLALRDAHAKGFSSTTKISLFIGLPDRYLVENVPSNVNLSVGGVLGRFFVEANMGQLIVEGIAMVSLPIKSDIYEKINAELETVKIFGNHNIDIQDERSREARNASQETSAPENS